MHFVKIRCEIASEWLEEHAQPAVAEPTVVLSRGGPVTMIHMIDLINLIDLIDLTVPYSAQVSCS